MSPPSGQGQRSLEGEAWRDVVGWEGWYQVSDHGRVRRVKPGPRTRPGRLLKARPDGAGYLTLTLTGAGKRQSGRINRLVAEAFLGPGPPTDQVGHRNGDKTDNRPANLQWVTKSAYASRGLPVGLAPGTHRLRPGAQGSRHPHAKLTEADVVKIRAGRGYVSQQALARQYGVGKSTIWSVQHRATWAHLPASPPAARKRAAKP